ncbi:MAG: DsrE family protein [Methanocellales archaeon]
MKKIGIIISHAPYGHEDAFAGLYVGVAALSRGMQVTILLLENGVYTAIKEHGDTLKLINLPSIEAQIKDIIDLGGRVLIDKHAAEIRGISQEEVIQGVEFADGKQLLNAIIDLNLTITF